MFYLILIRREAVFRKDNEFGSVGDWGWWRAQRTGTGTHAASHGRRGITVHWSVTLWCT